MAELQEFKNENEEKLTILTDIADGIFNIDTELTAMKNNNAETSDKLIQAVKELAGYVSDLDDRLRIMADTVETGFDKLGEIISRAIAQAVDDLDK